MFGSASGGRGFGGFAVHGQQQQSAQLPFNGQGGAASNPFQSSAAAAPVFGAPSTGFGAQMSTGFGPLASAPRTRSKSSGFGAPAPPSAPAPQTGPAFGTRSATKTTFGAGSGGGNAPFKAPSSGGGVHTTFGAGASGGAAHTTFGSGRSNTPFGDAAPQPQAPVGGNPFASGAGYSGGRGSAGGRGGRGGRGPNAGGRGPGSGGRGVTSFGGGDAGAFGGSNAALSGPKQPAGFVDPGAAPAPHTTFGFGAPGGQQRRGSRSKPVALSTTAPSFGGDAGSTNPFQPSQPRLSGPLPPDVGGARQPPGLQPRTTFGGAKQPQAPRTNQMNAPFGGGEMPSGDQHVSSNPFQAGGAMAFGEKPTKRAQRKRQPLNQDQSTADQPKRSPGSGMMTMAAQPSRSPPPTPAISPNSSSAPTTTLSALEKSELSSATNLDGVCIDMCSPAERELHIRVDELSVFEKCFPDEPGSERERIIKRFQRSSADHKLDIPEEIRPPGVLRRTQLYIEEHIMDLERSGDDPRFSTPRTPELIELYNFCWDRFRMIRKDFVLQNYRGAGGRVHPIALDVHERIARYHVLSEHELCEVTSFVAQQNMEQLGQTLKSLNELYDESRKYGDPRHLSPFEAECRAYFILCTLDNGRGLDVLKFVKGLPPSIMESPHVKFAMRVFVARHTGDYQKFFSLLKEATYLQACLLFRYTINMRSLALQRMNRGYRTQSYALADLVDLLCFEDLEHAAAVCQQHGLKLQKKAKPGKGEYVVVRFGGEFESDNQLRRNKTPLAIRASWRFIGVKKGNFLRRDICRGVTEYTDYPALSSLIQSFEDEERARLYPSRSRYVDDYSYFVDFAMAPPPGLSEQVRQSSNTRPPYIPLPDAAANGNYEDDSWGMEPEPDEQATGHELELIAQRKAELLKKQQEAMERIRELQRAKEERQRREREKKEEEEQREAEAKEKLATLAKQKAEKEAEVRRQEEELAQHVREAEQQRLLKLKQQREAEERRQREETAARIKRKQEEEERRRMEVMRAKAAEEERRRQETIRIEEARCREEAERERQRQIAAENARRKREAELEAKRQAQLARELAEKKRLRRIQKQKLAVLRFRFVQWKSYTRSCRHPVGPTTVRLQSVYEIASSSHKEKVDWLFAHRNGMSKPASLIMKKKGQDASAKRSVDAAGEGSKEPTPIPPVDVLGIVAPVLRARQNSPPVIPWKLLIVDLQHDSTAETTTSFGQWCAARAGLPVFSSDTLDSSDDTYRVYESLASEESTGVLACCRYVDTLCLASVADSSRLFTAVSSILVPVELTWIQDEQSYHRWDCAFEHAVSALPPTSQAALVILAGANAGIRKTAVAPLLKAIEQSARRVQATYASRVATVCFHLMINEDGDHSSLLPASMSRRFEQVLADAASNAPFQPQLVDTGLKEVLEATLHGLREREADATRPKSGEELQTQICDAMAQIHKEVFSSEAMQRDFPPPELESVLPEPPVGWNSRENQARVSTVLQTLASVRIDFAALDERSRALAADQVCDFYFTAAVEFVDRLFQSNGGAAAEVSLFELKKRLFAELLPIHERLTSAKVLAANRDPSRLVPWRRILATVYSAYVEALPDVSIYVPAESGLRRRVLEAAASEQQTPALATPAGSTPSGGKRAKMFHPVVISVKHLKDALGGRVPSIAVSLPAKTPAARRARATTRELQRLRVDLDREKAASSQFQRMLRLEVQRWSADSALP